MKNGNPKFKTIKEERKIGNMKYENSKLVISDELIDYLGNKFCKSKEIRDIFGSFHDFYRTYCVSLLVYEEKKSDSSKLFLQFIDAVEV